MLIEVSTCPTCQSKQIVGKGKNAWGQQRYKCKDCGETRVLDWVQKGRHLDMEQVNERYQERNSFRWRVRIFGVSQVSVQKWLKKSPKFSRL